MILQYKYTRKILCAQFLLYIHYGFLISCGSFDKINYLAYNVYLVPLLYLQLPLIAFQYCIQHLTHMYINHSITCWRINAYSQFFIWSQVCTSHRLTCAWFLEICIHMMYIKLWRCLCVCLLWKTLKQYSTILLPGNQYEMSHWLCLHSLYIFVLYTHQSDNHCI